MSSSSRCKGEFSLIDLTCFMLAVLRINFCFQPQRVEDRLLQFFFSIGP